MFGLLVWNCLLPGLKDRAVVVADTNRWPEVFAHGMRTGSINLVSRLYSSIYMALAASVYSMYAGPGQSVHVRRDRLLTMS